MALLTELVASVAKVEGLPETFVAGIAKYLREAGHIRQGGRGLSAAKMLPRDAAALLIGVNATRLAKDAVEVFEAYAPLKWSQNADDFPELSRLNLVRVVLSDSISLSEALTKLISLSVPEGMSTPPLQSVFEKGDFWLNIRFLKPMNVVGIEVLDEAGDSPAVMIRGSFLNREMKANESDRTDTVRITHRTILEVGKTLAS